MDINEFAILIDITFYLKSVQKLVFIVLIKTSKNEYTRDQRLKE